MKKYLPVIFRIIPALILLQTLYFKFTGSPESVYIFTQVGLEPVGRIGIGIVELIAAVLLLFPRTAWLGSLIALGIISGAIMMHLTDLGIEVQGDGGYLFALAILVWIFSAVVLWMNKTKLPIVGSRFN
ncbi:MAG: DoxX family protein [Bacteroidia bacterium]|nr:DoxX family protein [Bacteroidia bacterium]NNJ55256.1 DoxX family protein [Bacteroidia bacterium]